LPEDVGPARRVLVSFSKPIMSLRDFSLQVDAMEVRAYGQKKTTAFNTPSDEGSKLGGSRPVLHRFG
jgi:hypothetical protein